MRNRISLLIALPGIVALSLILLAQNGAQEQRGGRGGRGGRGNAAPSPPHDPHDLTGVWNFSGRNRSVIEPHASCVDSEGQKKFDANKPSYGRELGSADAAAHPEEHISRRRGVPLHWAMIPLATCNPLGCRACFSLAGPSKSFSFRIE